MYTEIEILENLDKQQRANLKSKLVMFENKGIESDSNLLLEEEDMASVRYRKDGRFELRFYFEAQQYSVYSKDRAKLTKKKEEKIKKLKREQRERKNKIQEKAVYTLNAWYEFWYNNYKLPFVSTQTAKEIKSLFKNHVLVSFGKCYLDEITIEILQAYLNKMPKTRKKELIVTYFNACMQKAEDLEHIKKNPFKLVVRDKKIKNIRKAFSIEEQERILNHIKNANYEHYKLILFYLATGVRRSEALAITSKDFNGQVLHVPGTKTDNADRYIKITKDLKNLIYKPGKIFDIGGSRVTHMFGDYLEELKITGTLHCLRHSYATNQYYLGTPAKQVQMNMGHSEINITLDIYTNIVAFEDKDKIVKKIKELYNAYYIEFEN